MTPDWSRPDPSAPPLFDPHSSSFFEALRRTAPEAMPEALGRGRLPREVLDRVSEGTTVLACTFEGGVAIAGDRRATAGHVISKKDMRKVFPADSHSAIAISGVAGPAMELAKIFATELEHYEKVEGEPLSLEGKANKLALMVRANLPLTLQGLVVVPLFAGVESRPSPDRDTTDVGEAAIFEYDPIGGRYQATDYAASGSGALVARGTLKRAHRPDMGAEEGTHLVVDALFDAAEEDSATGGPDLVRRIYPIVSVVTPDGYRELDGDEVAEHVERISEDRGRRRGH